MRTQQRDGSAGDGYRHTFTYDHGFGRVIQAKAEVSASQHSETTTAYTWFAAVARTSAPVFVAGMRPAPHRWPIAAPGPPGAAWRTRVPIMMPSG